MLKNSRMTDRKTQRKSAFTLIEIMVVLAIIGLLAALTISNIGGILSDSKAKITQLYVRQTLKGPLTAYRISVGDYPSTQEGLQALLTAPPTKGDRWRGPYIETDVATWPPLDPWFEPYQYRYPGTHNKDGYDLWSKGPDKIDGTEDDIGNWQKAQP